MIAAAVKAGETVPTTDKTADLFQHNEVEPDVLKRTGKGDDVADGQKSGNMRLEKQKSGNIRLEKPKPFGAGIQAAIDYVMTSLDRVRNGEEFPQGLLDVMEQVDIWRSRMEKTFKKFKGVAIKHAEDKGLFERGDVVITIKTAESRRPAWKSHAINNAILLAKEKKEEFDEGVYIAKVISETKKGSSTSVKLVRGV